MKMIRVKKAILEIEVQCDDCGGWQRCFFDADALNPRKYLAECSCGSVMVIASFALVSIGDSHLKRLEGNLMFVANESEPK